MLSQIAQNGKLSGATFIIEFSLLVYFFNKLNALGLRFEFNPIYWAMMILLFLSLYQLSEVIECSLEKKSKGKIFGHIAITFLPPLGLFMANSLGVNTYHTEYFSMVFGLGLVGYLAFNPDAVELQDCTGFFVKYNYRAKLENLYGIFYNGSLLAAIVFISIYLSDQGGLMSDTNALMLLGGYLIFTVPTAINIFLKHIDKTMATSVMCQWAFFFALILAFYINSWLV